MDRPGPVAVSGATGFMITYESPDRHRARPPFPSPRTESAEPAPPFPDPLPQPDPSRRIARPCSFGWESYQGRGTPSVVGATGRGSSGAVPEADNSRSDVSPLVQLE